MVILVLIQSKYTSVNANWKVPPAYFIRHIRYAEKKVVLLGKMSQCIAFDVSDLEGLLETLLGVRFSIELRKNDAQSNQHTRICGPINAVAI